MCGATAAQEQLQVKQANFYDQMTASYKTVFGKQQVILDTLTSMFKPILDKGPNQRGISPEARTSMETASIENVGHNYAHAEKELQEQIAARGGNDFLPQGGDLQLHSDISTLAAADRASQQNKIEQADWATGRDLWKHATGVLGDVASQLNPNATSTAATGAGSAAAETANQIAMASNSMWGSVIGGLSGIAGAAVGGWAQGKAGGGKSGGNG